MRAVCMPLTGLLSLHGHLVVTAMVVYAVGLQPLHMSQIDRVLRQFHEWEAHVRINHIINLTPNLVER